MDKYLSYVDPRKNIRGFIIGILVLALLGFAVGAAVVTTTPEAPSKDEELVRDERFSSPNIFVYGYWAGDRSEIKSFDLSSGEEKLLATLPLNVKHVRLLSPTEIIYINETDDSDYGSTVVVMTVPDGNQRTVVTANADVKIDDYRVSPNGQYVATWEVAVPEGSSQLYNGISRVYITDTVSGVKNQIYSEVANSPVHYPVAVTNDGRVFMDTFLPNDGAGWAYGMSVSDFSGVNKQNITSMTNGTYSSQPTLSPDGTMLVFTGYDGTKGAGTDIVRDTRRAILSANTVDVLDINSLSRRRLTNLSTENYYSKAWWDSVTGNVLVSAVSTNVSETGIYSYHLPSSLFQKIDLEELNSRSTGYSRPLSVLSEGVILAGSITTSESTLGNLGGSYDQVFEAMYLVNKNEGDIIGLDIVGGFVQPIDVKPSAYFGDSFALFSTDSNADTGGLKDKTQEQLQLQTFTIKPTLAPVRNEQQSGGRCRDVVANSCNELLGTNYTADEAAQARGMIDAHPDKRFAQCVKEQWGIATGAGCADSPLYLYGKKGSEFNVKVGAVVTESRLPYDPLDGFEGILTGDGGVEIGGKKYSSIEFNYNPAAKVIPPVNGVIIKRSEFDKKLNEYASNLGMNEKETYDFIKYIKANTTSNEIFLSHFSSGVSKKLLPLFITPNPDSYTNIVFYINESVSSLKPSFKEPNYEKIKRDGFTAVEISYISY